MKVTELTIIL